jgi:hypothetical protein
VKSSAQIRGGGNDHSLDGIEITSIIYEFDWGVVIMRKKDKKKKKVHGVDWSTYGFSWLDMETDPVTGVTEITGWGGYDKEEIEEIAKMWNACVRVMDLWKSELIEPDQSYARKKRVPKEWQEEWQ